MKEFYQKMKKKVRFAEKRRKECLANNCYDLAEYYDGFRLGILDFVGQKSFEDMKRQVNEKMDMAEARRKECLANKNYDQEERYYGYYMALFNLLGLLEDLRKCEHLCLKNELSV